jgi:hypothetical protein
VPESFKILVNELRALGLKVQIVDENDVAHDLRSLEDLDTLDEPKPKPQLGDLQPSAATDSTL